MPLSTGDPGVIPDPEVVVAPEDPDPVAVPGADPEADLAREGHIPEAQVGAGLGAGVDPGQGRHLRIEAGPNLDPSPDLGQSLSRDPDPSLDLGQSRSPNLDPSRSPDLGQSRSPDLGQSRSPDPGQSPNLIPSLPQGQSPGQSHLSKKSPCKKRTRHHIKTLAKTTVICVL